MNDTVNKYREEWQSLYDDLLVYLKHLRPEHLEFEPYIPHFTDDEIEYTFTSDHMDDALAAGLQDTYYLRRDQLNATAKLYRMAWFSELETAEAYDRAWREAISHVEIAEELMRAAMEIYHHRPDPNPYSLYMYKIGGLRSRITFTLKRLREEYPYRRMG